MIRDGSGILLPDKCVLQGSDYPLPVSQLAGKSAEDAESIRKNLTAYAVQSERKCLICP